MGKFGRCIEYTFPKVIDDYVTFNKENIMIKLIVQLKDISLKVKANVGYVMTVEQMFCNKNAKNVVGAGGAGGISKDKN